MRLHTLRYPRTELQEIPGPEDRQELQDEEADHSGVWGFDDASDTEVVRGEASQEV